MELSPQSVASTTFKTVKKGYDPDEVREYLTQLATAIESTQAQATAMEARARAAVARLQEMAANNAKESSGQSTSGQSSSSQSSSGQSTAKEVAAPRVGVDEAETISRTLLLAQRTADTTIAEAEAEAARVRDEARDLQSRLVDEAKVEARRAAEGARVQAESEVQALLARRDFLLSDVDHLEQHVITHRDRLRDVAGALNAIVERGPGGMGDLHRPLMSAVSEDETADAAAATGNGGTAAAAGTAAAGEADAGSEGAEHENAGAEDAGDATEAMPVSRSATADERPGDATPPEGTTGGMFDDVTGEIPAVSRPANDTFRPRSDDRR